MSFRLKILHLLMLLAFAANAVFAQKLPNKQQISIRSPGNIKVDGKLDEWGGQFAAYNKSTHLFYTIANSDDHIYLVAQSTDPETIRKIISYGITFTINSTAGKNKEALQLTQPVFKNAEDQTVISQCLKFNPGVFMTDTAQIRHRLDTMVAAMNEHMGNQLAMINTIGKTPENLTPGSSDFSGITTAGYFSSQLKYMFEIAIPLKYMAGFGDALSYNIKVNGTPDKNRQVTFTRVVQVSSQDLSTLQRPSGLARLPVVDDPADFSGEYKLVKN